MRATPGHNLRCTPTQKVRTSQNQTYPVHHKSPLEIISLFTSIAGDSSKINELRVQQGNRQQSYRPDLNLILRSDPGSFKSTILHSVGEIYGVKPYSNVTYPAMIGSINPNTGKLSPGAVWQTRNKPLLLDEFKTGERGDSLAVDVLLGVMEHGYYKRKIGLPSIDQYEEDGPLFYRIENGEIEVKTRFPTIIATMKNWEMTRSGKYAALTQRCVPIRYSLDSDVIDAVLDGAPVFKYHKFHPSPRITISGGGFKRLRKIAAEIREEKEEFKAVYTRAIGDLCRIYAVTRNFDTELFSLVCYLKAGLSLKGAQKELEAQ